MGTGMVSYVVAGNSSPSSRTGAVVIGTQSFGVTQGGILCTYGVMPLNLIHNSGSETGLVSVTTSNLCPWTISNTNSWVSIPGGTNRVGGTNLAYTVAANTSPIGRAGFLIVAGQLISISQAGINCGYSLSTNSQVHGFAGA